MSSETMLPGHRRRLILADVNTVGRFGYWLQVVMLRHGGKFGVKLLMTVMELAAIHILVADDGCPPELAEATRAQAVGVHITGEDE